LAIQRSAAPISLAYARAQVENITLHVCPVVHTIEEIERLLEQLKRLAPERAALD
jgi:hypothetical protein